MTRSFLLNATTTSRLLTTAMAALLLAAAGCPSISQAKQGATDPIPGTSKGATNSGGGGNSNSNSNKATTTSSSSSTSAPTPVQPTVAAPLTFVEAGPVNGYVPQCTGAYRIDPYYPTLSLLTVNVQASALNVPDDSLLYVTVVTNGGTAYPFTSNVITVVAQVGSCSFSEYVTPGVALTSVVISDAYGTVVFAGY